MYGSASGIQPASVPASAAAAAPNAFRLLLPRQALCLAVLVVALAGVALWVLQPLSWLPYSGTVHSTLLPQVLTGALLAGVALLAPVLARSGNAVRENGALHPAAATMPKGTLRHFLSRAAYIGLWLAAMQLFVLLIASRLAPLAGATILLATALLWLLALTLQSAAAAFPRLYTGAVFFWLIGLPVMAYFLAEIFMMSPGAGGWMEPSGPGAMVHGCVKLLLNIAPSTFIIGVLNGSQPGGDGVSWLNGIGALLPVLGASILALATNRLRMSSEF